MTTLHFPNPADARIAAELRGLCRDFALTGEQSTKVLSRFLRTINEGRSGAVSVMEARRILHGFERGANELSGGAA